MFFRFVNKSHWPPCCWLAKCRRNDKEIEVAHGDRVETAPDCFSEAVWSGCFEGGDLDSTDIVFGSGCRIREDSCVFVSSGTTVDRLQYHSQDGLVIISNSLVCLLHEIGAELNASYDGYFRDLGSIKHGLEDYRHVLATSVGNVHLVYYDNLLWNRDEMALSPKPFFKRNFSSFANYHSFLTGSLQSLHTNMTAEGRSFPYSPLGTISAGYDSATVAALCRTIGMNEIITCDRSRKGSADSGARVANLLGLKAHTFPRDAWKQYPGVEADFISGDAQGGDVFIAGANGLLAGTALLTGFNGGNVWGMNRPAAYNRFARRDRSGLSLTEFRLRLGFQHIPVPYLGALQRSDIEGIGRSQEMAPWRRMQSYDRPICARILEEAGIDHELLSREKLAASVHFFKGIEELSPDAFNDYTHWLKKHYIGFGTKKTLSLHSVTTLLRLARPLLNLLLKIFKISNLWIPAISRNHRSSSFHAKITLWTCFDPKSLYIFPWAVDRQIRKFWKGRSAHE